MDIQEEPLIVNPNEVENEMEVFSEDYVMDDIDNEEFDKNLDDLSLSDLVTFPEDLKNFGIDINCDTAEVTMEPFTRASLSVPDLIKFNSSTVVDNEFLQQPGDGCFLDEVEVTEDSILPEEQTLGKNEESSDNDIVDVGSPNDILFGANESKQERPVIFANHKSRFKLNQKYKH